MVPFERAMIVSYRLFIVTIALCITKPFDHNLLSNVSLSDAQINKGWVILWYSLWRKGLTDVSKILMRSGRDIGLSYAKEMVLDQYLMLFEHSA